MEKVVKEKKDIVFYMLLYPVSFHKDAYLKSKSIMCNRSLKMLEEAFAKKEIPKVECDYIYGFRVKPAYRGFGLGTRMMYFVELDLQRRGFPRVCLNLSQENTGRARRLYERLGYRVVSEEPGRWAYIDDQGRRQDVHEPAWRMEKELLPT